MRRRNAAEEAVSTRLRGHRAVQCKRCGGAAWHRPGYRTCSSADKPTVRIACTRAANSARSSIVSTDTAALFTAMTNESHGLRAVPWGNGAETTSMQDIPPWWPSAQSHTHKSTRIPTAVPRMDSDKSGAHHSPTSRGFCSCPRHRRGICRRTKNATHAVTVAGRTASRCNMAK